MKLEQQVPTLELCKKLKELGYPQEGSCWWVLGEDRKYSIVSGSEWIIDTDGKNATSLREEARFDVLCVAPTVAELMRTLPKKVEKWEEILTPVIEIGESFSIRGVKLVWFIHYREGDARDKTLHTENGSRLADILAKMLIWLVENDYLKFGGE